MIDIGAALLIGCCVIALAIVGAASIVGRAIDNWPTCQEPVPTTRRNRHVH